MSNYPTHLEAIRCPECSKLQLATVEHTWPWFSYVHECTDCGYIIMESEWPRLNTIKIITVLQPWASIIAAEIKRFETRAWRPAWPFRRRGPMPLAIHAGKSKAFLPYVHGHGSVPRNPETHEIGENAIVIAGLELDYSKQRDREQPFGLPVGAIIAIADVTECHRADDLALTNQEWGLGDFSSGRYAWEISNVTKLPKPIPYRGAQGLRDLPTTVLREVSAS